MYTHKSTGLDRIMTIAQSDAWKDYELLDSGNGRKLERFGPYTFDRPESQALWKPILPQPVWEKADGIFQESAHNNQSTWKLAANLPKRWKISYKNLTLWVEPTPFRHLGVFPEQANHWDWIANKIINTQASVRILNLFGYTGIASLSAAAAGAAVTHVDSSKKAILWAKENQALSNLENKPIRWIVDDALAFVRREIRRDAKYHGIIIDPPKFGRGPQGEIWKLEEMLPILLSECSKLLDNNALFIVLTVYAVRLSSTSLHYSLKDIFNFVHGSISSGELAITETSGNRRLSPAIYSRWSAK